MTTIPGPEFTISDNPPPRSAQIVSGRWFIAGITEKGNASDALTPVKSMSEYGVRFGARAGGVTAYDAAETFFREGGSELMVSRVFGPSPVLATLNLLDGSSAVSLVVKAISPGTWGNALKAAVLAGDAGGNFKIQVSLGTTVVETSPDLADTAAAVAWGANSSYVRITQGASTNDPATLTATSLATGTDDSGSAGDTEWENALNQFTSDLGPGQVSMPGRTTDNAHDSIAEHAAAHGRVAYMDLPDTHTVATLKASALAIRGRSDRGDRFSGCFAPWAVVPGVLPGTTRTVPYSAVQAGISARNDSRGLSPNVPGAGELGQAVYAIGLSQLPWTDAERGDLNGAGVNVVRIIYGGVRTYGFRTCVNPDTDPNWVELSGSRVVQTIRAKCLEVEERFQFAELDGRRRKINEYGGNLIGELMPYWTEGSLYGDTPGEAFSVDVGAQVNTDTTIANRELHAKIGLKTSPFAEKVFIELAKLNVTEVLPA